MASAEPGKTTLAPSPDHPGWQVLTWPDPEGFNVHVIGPTLVRRDGPGQARIRIDPPRHFANVIGNVHGGALLGLIDMSLFVALLELTGRDPGHGVTLDLATQFITAGQFGRPLDTTVEILRETGRLVFLRGAVEQDGTVLTGFHATVRKVDPRP